MVASSNDLNRLATQGHNGASRGLAPRLPSIGSVPLLACLLCCAVLGCSRGDRVGAESILHENRVRMNALAIFYDDYVGAHQGKPPKSTSDFREHVASRFGSLQPRGVESIDAMLTSLRDQQPFVIVCNRRGVQPDSLGATWAAYEQEGVEGSRMAVRVRGGAFLFDEEEIAKIESGR